MEYPTLASVRLRWDPLAGELAGFVASQSAESVAKNVDYRNLKGDPMSYPLGQLMLHAVNHSTYHRGQVTTLLRQLGAQPVSTDLVLYYAEKAKKP